MKRIALLFFFITFINAYSSTRWSANTLIPDADFYNAGEFTLSHSGFLSKGRGDQLFYRPSFPFRIGLSHFLNVSIAYYGGVSFSIKGKILSENARFRPSIAVGVHNMMNHKEVHFYNYYSRYNYNSEIFLAISKSIHVIRTRFHIGIQSIPDFSVERFNPFFSIEKYFGVGLYATLEGYRRDRSFNLSLFSKLRLLNNRLEISAGAVGLQSMFFDSTKEFAVSLASQKKNSFTTPGIWLGVTFRGNFLFGKNKGIRSFEDRLKLHQDSLRLIRQESDSLKSELANTRKMIQTLDSSIVSIFQQLELNEQQLRNLIYDKLLQLQTVYSTEPFLPENANALIRNITGYKSRAVPILTSFLVNPAMAQNIRIYSAALLGKIGDNTASDALIKVLTSDTSQEIKVEILIALGKLKETRAILLIEQLASSGNNNIAITAQDILRQLKAEISNDENE